MAINPLWLPHPDDELVHTPAAGDSVLPWKDTWFFMVYDRDADFALSMHTTVSADRSPDTRIAVAVRHGARETLDVHRADGIRGQTIGNDLVQLEVLHSAWDSTHELRLTGRLEHATFDLRVLGHHHAAPLWDTMFPGFYQSGASGHTYSHVEQSTRVSGTVTWNGEPPVEIAGPGWRDRGWGRRKSETSFASGYDVLAGVTADDAVFTLMSFRNPDVAADAPMPVGAWYAAPGVLVPATGGFFHKESAGWPAQVDLSFANGVHVAGRLLARRSTIAVPFHEAEPERTDLAHGIRDYFTDFEDADGRVIPVWSNTGVMHRANPTFNARFLSAT